MSKYWDKCLDEIERMKEEKVGNGITFYDILIGKSNRFISHIRTAKVALDKDKHKKFSIYANEIRNQYTTKLEKD
ncbi:MAG: hypothetical protein ACR5KV_02245 [Wolbachia sp.]